MEKRAVVFAVMLAVMFVFLIIINLAFASAELSLKVTAQVNDYSSDCWIKTNSNAGDGFDAYDMPVRSPPSNYSQLYSSITGYSLAVDSWPSSTRTLNLVYNLDEAQVGTLTFSWIGSAWEGYGVALKDYGVDSSYTSQTGSNVNMKTQSSYSKTLSGSESNIYIQIEVTPVTEETAAAATSSGGGGGKAAATGKGIVITNTAMDVYMALDEVKTRKISLYNEGDKEISVNLNTEELEDFLIIGENSFNLGPGERKNIDVKIAAPEKPGIYTGKIIVKGIKEQKILVTLNVNTKELLFDAAVVIPDGFKVLNLGENLESQITLIPMGKLRADVSLIYVIKDFEGRTFLTESETILIEKEKIFKKEFSTGNLPVGKYILGLEVIYPNSIATSSSHFEVEKSELPALPGNKIALLVLGLGVLILLILIILITRNKKIKKHRIIRK